MLLGGTGASKPGGPWQNTQIDSQDLAFPRALLGSPRLIAKWLMNYGWSTPAMAATALIQLFGVTSPLL